MDGRFRRASGKTGRFLVEIVAAIFVGIGVPLFWIWLGSQIQGARGVSTTVETTTAAIMIVGILATYLVILIIAGAIQAREQGARRPPTRSSRSASTRSSWRFQSGQRSGSAHRAQTSAAGAAQRSLWAASNKAGP